MDRPPPRKIVNRLINPAEGACQTTEGAMGTTSVQSSCAEVSAASSKVACSSLAWPRRKTSPTCRFAQRTRPRAGGASDTQVDGYRGTPQGAVRVLSRRTLGWTAASGHRTRTCCLPFHPIRKRTVRSRGKDYTRITAEERAKCNLCSLLRTLHCSIYGVPLTRPNRSRPSTSTRPSVLSAHSAAISRGP